MPLFPVADLIGPALDYAVAVTGKEWERAHIYTPTTGLLSEYGGAAITRIHGDLCCILTPAAPGGQPFRYSPSTDGRAGLALQQAEFCDVWYDGDMDWLARANDQDGDWTGDHATGDAPMIALCRAVIVSRVGQDIDLPDSVLDTLVDSI